MFVRGMVMVSAPNVIIGGEKENLNLINLKLGVNHFKGIGGCVCNLMKYSNNKCYQASAISLNINPLR